MNLENICESEIISWDLAFSGKQIQKWINIVVSDWLTKI